MELGTWHYHSYWPIGPVAYRRIGVSAILVYWRIGLVVAYFRVMGDVTLLTSTTILLVAIVAHLGASALV